MRQLFSNNAASSLAVALSDTGTSLTVKAGEGALFKAPTGTDYELVTLSAAGNIEIVKVTARSADTLTIVRAQEGTSARAWAIGTAVEARITAGTLDGMGFNLAPDPVTTLMWGDTVSYTGQYGVVLGAWADVTGDNAVAIGPSVWVQSVNSVTIGNGASAYGNDEGTALGAFAFTGALAATAVGRGAGALADYSIGMGRSCRANNIKSIAIGYQSETTGDFANALGSDAFARVPQTTQITGPIISRKDNNEAAADAFRLYAGAQVVLTTKEIDLLTLADDAAVLTIPTGSRFYIDEIGLIVTASSGVTGQPSIAVGNTTGGQELLATVATTKSALYSRELFAALTPDGQASLYLSVKAAGAGTTLKGRFTIKGQLVEIE